MLRFTILTASLSLVFVGVAAGVAACSGTTTFASSGFDDDAAVRHDSGIVDPPEGGPMDAGASAPAPSCDRYCDLVMANCRGDDAQYGSNDECLAFCALMPPGKTGDSDNPSVACRQSYAGSPAMTDSVTYCLAAGPFGGGVCGDRCTAFCQLALAACPSDDGHASNDGARPFGSLPECATACAAFDFEAAGADGGGEGPDGPDYGNTLNCRFFELRQVVANSGNCESLGQTSPICN
ncbi:MAG: hypothetical protein FWD69_15715 [Polyangiaceae bacterium]|nr:hypothetical protein [Polyangiaceae bacterium]